MILVGSQRSEVRDQALSSVACPAVAASRRGGRLPSFALTTFVATEGRLSSPVCRLASGFTLVELLVVIVVIAILMGITLPVSKYAIYRAKAARQEVMLAKIRSALDDYRAAYGEYPITPDTNRPPINYSDAIRHYPDNYPTECYYTTNSPYTNVYLTSSGTVENIIGYQVDYCLTYPLMLKQSDKGARPFYAFPDVTVVSLVYKRWAGGGDEYERKVRLKGGAIGTLVGLVGRQINRPKAIDPVSGYQWKYECYNGTSYSITTNNFY